ncbi:MAG: sensor histidine kinase [Acidimicrobiales bacterium]
MKSFFGPLGRVSTYARMAYLLLGLPLGIAYFTFLVTAISVGLGLVIVWVGVVILFAAMLAWRALGGFERGLSAALLGVPIQSPPSPITAEMSRTGKVRALLTDSYTWRSLLWLMIRFPMGVLGFVLVVVLLSVSFALLAAPASIFLDGHEHSDFGWLADLPEYLIWLLPIGGVFLVVASAHIISGLGDLYGLLARPLLGPSAAKQRADLQERTDVLEERTLLAHELHDSVGHTLTMMVVQAGAGGHVFDRDPEFGRRALQNIEVSGRRAMGELDRILGIMRDDADPERHAQPTLGQVPNLIQEMTAAGARVSLTDEVAVKDLPAEVSRSGYRIIQEALTNVLKHAGPVPTEVRISRSGGALEIDVTNGPPHDSGLLEAGKPAMGGRGITGIRERVAMLGGSAEIGPRPDGGYRVRVSLPVEAVHT